MVILDQPDSKCCERPRVIEIKEHLWRRLSGGESIWDGLGWGFLCIIRRLLKGRRSVLSLTQ